MPRRARIYNQLIYQKFSIAGFLNIIQIVHFFVMMKCRLIVSFSVSWNFWKNDEVSKNPPVFIEFVDTTLAH